MAPEFQIPGHIPTGMPTDPRGLSNTIARPNHKYNSSSPTAGPNQMSGKNRQTAMDDMHATRSERVRPKLEELKAPEAFDDAGREPAGNQSPTVESRLRASCAGWKTIPTAEEFYQAVHDPKGNDRETAILLTWYHEAETREHVKARLEGAYSWRQLVQALHRVGLTRGQGAQRINRFATT